jgi:hypothetical protein
VPPLPPAVLVVADTSSSSLSRRAVSILLLSVTFGTAVASFIYEITWIRMLSLVLGSATHSFDLMLSPSFSDWRSARCACAQWSTAA